MAAGLLAGSERVAVGGIGYAGVTSLETLAWRVIARAPERSAIFRQVYDRSGVVGKLYALAGLRTSDPTSYAAAAAELLATPATVNTISGCIAWYMPISTLLADIDDGQWARAFYQVSGAAAAEIGADFDDPQSVSIAVAWQQ